MSKFTETLNSVASEFGVEPETHEETHAEPPITLGRVDDFDRMAANWRCALTLMESYLRDQFGTIRSCPDTAKHFAAIAAILAQSEINA